MKQVEADKRTLASSPRGKLVEAIIALYQTTRLNKTYLDHIIWDNAVQRAFDEVEKVARDNLADEIKAVLEGRFF